MDPKFQTSFIPRRPMMPGGMAAAQKKSSFNLFGVVSGVVFFITLALSAGSFAYEKILMNENEQKKSEIKAEISNFDPELVSELTTLKARLDTAVELLRNHIALTEFFTMLEENTVSTIEFSSFSFRGNTKGDLEIELKGMSPSFNDLVLQSDTFLAESDLKDVRFSGFNVDDEGDVAFTVSATLDPRLVSYEKVVSGLAVSAPSAESSSQTPSSGDGATSASPSASTTPTSSTTPITTPITP